MLEYLKRKFPVFYSLLNGLSDLLIDMRQDKKFMWKLAYIMLGFALYIIAATMCFIWYDWKLLLIFFIWGCADNVENKK